MSVKRATAGIMLAMLSLTAMLWMTGCEMPWESDDDDDPGAGTSTIKGVVDDFQLSAAKKAAGITVYLDGPVDRETITDSNGVFVFSGLPSGKYTLSFMFNGEKVRYRGNSGQDLEINLEDDQQVQLLNVRISGGVINIGNIRVTDLAPSSSSSSSGGSDDSDDATEAATTTTTTGGGATPAKLTLTIGRGL